MNKHIHDTHFHLDLFNENLHAVAKKIEQERIFTIAVTNLPPLYKDLVKKLSNNYKYIRPALGFHPELIGQYQSLIPKMWELLPIAKYIGEVGLDYKTGIGFKNEQVTFFEKLIEKCNNYGDKILTVHSRRSADDIVSIIGNDFNGKYILHWYSGNLRTLRKAIDNGAYFSINYSMTISNSGKKIISEIPFDRLLIESDGPFIKFNKKPFTPLNNEIIISNLSKIINKSEKTTSDILYNNFKTLITI